MCRQIARIRILPAFFSIKRISENGSGKGKNRFSDKKPLCYLSDVWEKLISDECGLVRYEDEGVFTDVYSWGNGQTCFYAQGPDNPSTGNIQYLIERRYGKKVVCAHVIDTWKKRPEIEKASFQKEEKGFLVIEITEALGQKKEITFML